LEITNGVVLLKRMTHDFPKYVNENNDRYWRNSEGEEALELKKQADPLAATPEVDQGVI